MYAIEFCLFLFFKATHFLFASHAAREQVKRYEGLDPPPELLEDIVILCKFFINVHICLKQERPEMDDFERKKTLVVKKEYLI